MSIRIVAGEVQKIYARKDDKESTKQRYRVDGVRGVKSLEQNEGGAESRGRESDIVKRVHTAGDLGSETTLRLCGGKEAYIEVEKEFNALLK